MTRPFFNRERITDFDIFDRHANDAIAQVMDRLTTGHPVDFQDVVSRFTLDSATEFLFGNDIRTLSAGLPYPPSISPNTFANHPSNLFASAFVAGQISSVRRTVFGSSWPLDEFWKNEVIPHRKVVDEFIEPVLMEALSKRAREMRVESKLSADREKADTEEETLLSHLLDQTQGISRFISLVYSHAHFSLRCSSFER
ncbi:hypothetical protein L208DRAFT_643690 [Tricholoma matsutake]|nr:hypothetical protein L208DRAFT_643690 [Tricholoma matsutake 945]